MAIVLGIETSCDETAAAIYCGENGLLSHTIHSQIPLHKIYGGVVPELASRDHVNKLIEVVAEVCEESGIGLSDLDAIAYTAGPGLAGALMVGSGFATSLAMTLGIPSLPTHHLEAHVLIAMLDVEKIKFPFLALLVSGGHTQIILASALGEYKLIAETLDDAIGEAFDKSAKMMGMPYPGGRELASLAEDGDPKSFDLPRPMINRPGYDLSFSGLKTAVFQAWDKSDQSNKTKCNLAASFQAAVVESCCSRLSKVMKDVAVDTLVVAGGVAANKSLRDNLTLLASSNSCEIYFPPIELCTDNGAMIAYAGYLNYVNKSAESSTDMQVKPRWPIEDYFK